MRFGSDLHDALCRVSLLCLFHKLWNFRSCDHVYVVICDLVMNRKLKRRTNVKFCVKVEKSAIETLSRFRQSYGDEAMFRKQYFARHRLFKSQRTYVEMKDDLEYGHHLRKCGENSQSLLF